MTVPLFWAITFIAITLALALSARRDIKRNRKHKLPWYSLGPVRDRRGEW